jgi:hypothetical protein
MVRIGYSFQSGTADHLSRSSNARRHVAWLQ